MPIRGFTKVPRKLIVFDLDGTLVDSVPVVSSILNEKRGERGHPPLAPSAFYPWVSLGGVAMVSAALEIHPGEAERELLDFRARYAERPTPPESLYPWAKLAVSAVLAAKFEMALCTNKPRNLAEKVLADLGITNWFSFVNAGGDLPRGKPDPSNLRSCLEFFGVEKSEALMVGDSSIDQTMAAVSGVPFLFFEGGYDDGVDKKSAIGSFLSADRFLDLVKG